MNLFQLATAVQPAPQSIPDGFGGVFDWSSIDNAEKARRGWVLFSPPAFDPLHERIETVFAQGDGIWKATYTVVPGPTAPASPAAWPNPASSPWPR